MLVDPLLSMPTGDRCFKSSSEKMDLALLVDEGLDMSLKCALAA